MKQFLFVGVVALTAGCFQGPRLGPLIEEGEEVELDGGNDGGIEEDMTFLELQAEVFVPTCAGSQCHRGNPPPLAPMSLENGNVYNSLVGKASVQQSSLKRVEPGNPSASYLMHKLKGTAGSVGGTSTRMPLNKPALSAETIRQIERWISRGAPND
jgi:hypothetical protein